MWKFALQILCPLSALPVGRGSPAHRCAVLSWAVSQQVSWVGSFLNNMDIDTDTGKGVSGCQNTGQFRRPVVSQIPGSGKEPSFLPVSINTRRQARNSHTLFSRDSSSLRPVIVTQEW